RLEDHRGDGGQAPHRRARAGGPGQRGVLQPEIHRRQPRADRPALRWQLLAQSAVAPGQGGVRGLREALQQHAHLARRAGLRADPEVTADLLLQAVVSGLLLGGVYGLVASGLSLIFGVLRIINFAHGAVMMLAMYATYWLFTLLRVDPYLSILVTGPAFFLLGMVIQRAVIEPNRFAAEHNQLLLTLGLALFLENLALVLWQGDFRTVRPSY